MVKSMYSGVAGMKSHQTRMDVIGNNIANVNTYGFKASRVTFRDVYYQTVSGASEASTTRGGVNPSAIGAGAKVSSVDLLMNQASFSTTDSGLDLAIAGDGFFMVQDPDGNTFYTRAGMLNIDEAGNVVDSNGNFVLGISGDPLGREPSNEKIQIQLPSVEPAAASAEEIINNKEFTFTTSNPTGDSNITLNFLSSETLPGGQFAKAEITTTGIVITLNANETFANAADFNTKINAAITEANDGVEHPAGTITVGSNLTYDPFQNLTGEEIASKDFGVTLGSIEGFPNDSIFKGVSMKVDNVSSNFAGGAIDTAALPTVTYDSTLREFTITVTVGGTAYTGAVKETYENPGSLQLATTGTPVQFIEVTHPGFTALGQAGAGTGTFDPADATTFTPADLNYTAAEVTTPPTATASTPSQALGLSLKAIPLTGGTEGGPQTVADLSSLAIAPDGTIEGMHPELGRLQLGRISVATFENPQGLLQAGNTYFQTTANSGDANYVDAGTGGSGALAAGSLELSNVDLAKEFADMIVTQRGFQANSRLITVSDEMLTELVNLKR